MPRLRGTDRLAAVATLVGKCGLAHEDDKKALSPEEFLAWQLSESEKLLGNATLMERVPASDIQERLRDAPWLNSPATKCVNCGEWLILFLDTSYLGRVFWVHAMTTTNTNAGKYVNPECPPRYAKAYETND